MRILSMGGIRAGSGESKPSTILPADFEAKTDYGV
jgi:hypothetical protein